MSDTDQDVVAVWMREIPFTGVDHDRALMLGLIRYLNKNGWRFHAANADGVAGVDWWVCGVGGDRIKVPNLRCLPNEAAYAVVRAIECIIVHVGGQMAIVLSDILREQHAVVEAMKLIDGTFFLQRRIVEAADELSRRHRKGDVADSDFDDLHAALAGYDKVRSLK